MPKVGGWCRFWFGLGFIRAGKILAIDDDDGMVWVRWDYQPLPNTWERIDSII